MAVSAQGLVSTKRARIVGLNPTIIPASVSNNSAKEELCLEYVDNFRRQFVELFSRRRPLLLTAKNEAGVEKFVSTTIRPSLLSHKELYEYKACAEFIADYIQYEPLANPEALPEYLPSPSQVLKWRVGDAFDMSIVLTSLLIGAGYDAYCVSGTAPKWVTTRDTSLQKCPYVEPRFEEAESADAPAAVKPASTGSGAGAGGSSSPSKADASGRSKYYVEPKPTLESKYAAAMQAKAVEEEAQRKRIEDGLHLLEEERRAAAEAAAAVPDVFDHISGRRIHCWVLVRAGKRGVDAHVFIEPSTGIVYPVTGSPYESVESVWNNRNLWVNMQAQILLPEAFVPVATRPGSTTSRPPTQSRTITVPRAPGLSDSMPPSVLARTHFSKARDPLAGTSSPARASADTTVSSLSFDLKNSDNWEYTFIESVGAGVGGVGSESKGGEGETGLEDSLLGGGGEDVPEGKAGGGEVVVGDGTGGHVLDLPKSWSPKLIIDRDSFLLRFFGSGSRTSWYYKAKVEQYAPRVNEEGLLARLSLFSDPARTEVARVVEVYGSRSDKLVKRVRIPLEMRVEEYFGPGKPSGLRQHIEILGKQRELLFYVAGRIDGLRKRVETIGVKIIEWYDPSVDSALTYRSATLMGAEAASALAKVSAAGAAVVGAQTPGAPPAGVPATKAINYPTITTEAGELPIVKLTEKFARTPSVEAHSDPARITYNIEEQTIAVTFHHAAGRITASSRVYLKQSGTAEITTVDPFAPPVRDSELELGFRDAVHREKECISAIKGMQRVIGDLLKARAKEELAHQVEKSAFDIARERAKAGLPDDNATEEVDMMLDKKFDFLAPFLQFVQDPSNITKEEAKRADHECRKAMRARLVERVNIIQRRLDEENEKLQKKQQEFQRNRDQVEGAEEEFEKFCAEAMFRIGILEQRLQRHEETVMSKYAELERQLKADPRLAALSKP